MGGLISHAIPNLFNGISQQSPSIRQPSQCELQENCYSSIVDGVHKRHATKHIAKLSPTAWTDAYVHLINRDVVERYVVAITNGNIQVWGVDGVARTVTAPSGLAYLTTTTPSTSFAVVTIADYTFIVNKTVTTAMTVGGAAVALTGTVQTFSKLPATGVLNGVYKITGDNASAFGAYYVMWNGTVYVETTGTTANNTFNALTMPHQLVRNADGTFTFSPVAWQPRLTGDDVSNPIPSMIGKTINDIVFFRNRLGFLAGENIVLSRSGEFFAFRSETATQILDTDPIDVAVSNVKVSTLRYAIPFSRNLLLFSEQSQFVLAATDTLTQKTVVLHQTTEFECSSKVKPVASGSNVYFAVDRSGFTGFREYFVASYQLTFDADDITAHVPRYIPGGVFKMCGSTNENVIFALSGQDRASVYVYKYYWSGQEKAQSSWSKWTLPGNPTILSMEMMNTKLYLVVQRADGVSLEVLDVQVGYAEVDLPLQVHLDRKAVLTGVYSAVTGLTTWTLPYSDEGVQVVAGGGFIGRAGQLLTTTQTSPTTLTAVGDFSAATVYAGVPYTARYRFSIQYYRDQNKTAVADAILKLRNMKVYYTKSGYFRAEVTPLGRPMSYYTFTGKTIGTTAMVMGSAQLDSGVFKFDVFTDASNVKIELVNDSYLPSFFQSAEWMAMMTTKSQRV